MLAQGYGYAIIGDAGPMDFYNKTVGAVAIPGSYPGVYRGMLQQNQRRGLAISFQQSAVSFQLKTSSRHLCYDLSLLSSVG